MTRHPLMRTLQIAWQRTQRRLGWAGLGGAALLLAGVAAALALPGAQQRAQALSEQLERVRGAVVPPPAAVASPAQDRQQALAELGARLPRLRDNAADLAKLFALAQAHKLDLAKGDYQLGTDPRAPLQTYSVTLPVQQSYAALKTFSAEVLRALPHAALDELRLERHDAASTQADARLRFTFIYQGE
jgi:hypothetical protein